MSGFLLFIVAIALLGVAVYSLVSYIKERRAGQLPTDKKRNNFTLPIFTPGLRITREEADLTVGFFPSIQ
ncbi:hypothetical protein DR72_2812 [Klebsiella aerogenes]|nr:hypothetical protein DR72_2812 [Klebsiella aerogenes]KJF82175.1 hypothetical protein UA44_07570 [Klebsiella aerogenes]